MAEIVRWRKEFSVPPDDRDGTTGIKFEDGGRAAIMYAPLASMYQRDGATLYDPAFFVRLHSWEENVPAKHTLFRSLMGRRVRVTIETIDDEKPWGEDQATDAALVREEEADRLFAEREAKRGRGPSTEAVFESRYDANDNPKADW